MPLILFVPNYWLACPPSIPLGLLHSRLKKWTLVDLLRFLLLVLSSLEHLLTLLFVLHQFNKAIPFVENPSCLVKSCL